MAGFDAVPEELQETAGRIGEVVSGVANMVWRRPSGDYGHPGVQAGWDQFVEQLKAHVEALRDTVEEFGGKLNEAAGKYRETEAESGGTLKAFGDLVESHGGAIGGGIAGGAAGGVAGESPVVPSVPRRERPRAAPRGRASEAFWRVKGRCRGRTVRARS
ncbi:hypothetical protein [Saccharomonospora sp.]|uniref:hypothetical protein n=1 Tax=Saccharomonospora sp. TaxID=33913 RepID=UPI0026128F49|nr:hypothetical protein [Saccharomonospora sp.]